MTAYAQKAGWTENGKLTLLDERQTAIIVEAMKQAQHNQTKDTFQAGLEGIETTQSRAVRIAGLARQQQKIDRQIRAELQAELAELRAQREANRPKVEFFDQVADSKDAISMREIAGVLNIPGWGRNTLFEYLRSRGVLDNQNIPYRKYQTGAIFGSLNSNG